MSRSAAIPALLLTLLPGCAFWLSGPVAASPRPRGQTATNANSALDACSLLSPADITAVLGEPLQELKPTVRVAGNMNMSQCLFVTRDAAKSASVAVAMPASADLGAPSVRDLWRNQFHSPRKQEEKSRPASRKSPAESAFNAQSETEADEDARKARPVPALGEEAFWVGNAIAGALYVLQGDLFLRISLGGIPQESTRIAKSKSLARAILPRLHRRHP